MGSIIGGITGAMGANKSADRQALYYDAMKKSLAEGGQATEARLQPTAQVGTNAITNLNNILNNGDMSAFFQSPDYQYAMDQAMRQVNASAAKQGTLMSGNTLKELQKNASGLASQNYNGYIANLQNLFTQADPYLGAYDKMPYLMAQDRANILGAMGQNYGNAIQQKYAGIGQTIGGIADLGMSAFGGGGGMFSTLMNNGGGLPYQGIGGNPLMGNPMSLSGGSNDILNQGNFRSLWS